jgi:hypothetical protein
MKDKTETEIREAREPIIKLLRDYGYEVVNTVFNDWPTEGLPKYPNVPLKYLARCLDLMAEVDLVYFMPGWENARGCRIEHEVCQEYGIEAVYTLDSNTFKR